MCIEQQYISRNHRVLQSADLNRVLLDSLSEKTSRKLWNLYKRLCKKSPLDIELLNKVVTLVTNEVDVEFLQRQFEFY